MSVGYQLGSLGRILNNLLGGYKIDKELTIQI